MKTGLQFQIGTLISVLELIITFVIDGGMFATAPIYIASLHSFRTAIFILAGGLGMMGLVALIVITIIDKNMKKKDSFVIL